MDQTTRWEAEEAEQQKIWDTPTDMLKLEERRLWQEYVRLRSITSGRSETELERISRKRTWNEWDLVRTELAVREDSDRHALSAAQAARDRSNLGERFGDRTFETFIASRAKDAFDICKAYSESDAAIRNGDGILLYGKQGVGKTHLAAAIANALVDRGIFVLFDTYSNHLNKLKQEFNSKEERKYLKRLMRVPMLVIDDLGKEKQTDWTQQVMFDIINYRYEHKLPVVITTNLSMTNLEHYLDAAVFSRLCEMCRSICIIGSDFRRQI